MSDWYVLADDGKTPVRVPSMITDPQGYAAAMRNRHERYDWCVRKTQVTDDIKVSTVFLFLDHRIGPGKSMLWETLVFGGGLDQECERYTSRDDAERGHEAMVQRVREAEGLQP